MRSSRLPKWVVEHLIALCDYAEDNDLPGFEEKLLEAAEAALAEANAKRSIRNAVHDAGPVPTDNVVHLATRQSFVRKSARLNILEDGLSR